MNRTISIVGTLGLVVFVILAYIAYRTPAGYWQDLLMSLSTTFLGLGIGVIAVNAYLSSADKRQFAKPVLKMIAPNIQELHNELFIKHLHKSFGKNDFEALMDVYNKHNRNPKAFSPKQRDDLYSAIEAIKPELLRLHELLGEQLRELTLLLGWSFDSRVTSAALTARLGFATFKGLNWDGSDASKTTAIEAYLDSEAATSATVKHLISYLGVKDSDWKEEA
jgi:hypothetical protein